jgi:5-formyltetrahydrofolate cyclo-ligase
VTESLKRLTKKQLRAEVLAGRAGLRPEVVARRAEQLSEQIEAFAHEHRARTVTAYASVGSEPGTRLAIERLHRRDVRILLPVLLPDLDLDWADYTPDRWRASRMGLVEPSSPRLGREAIAEAEVIFCPGVAGTPDGRRLGRGGGCYDRALTRASGTAVRCLVVYDEDVLDDIPTSTHDQSVDVIITPTRVLDARPS